MSELDDGTPDVGVREFCLTRQASSGIGGYYERFIGDRATVTVSERSEWTRIHPSGYFVTDPGFEELEVRGYILPVFPESEFVGRNKDRIYSRPSRPLPEYTLPGECNKPVHQPHLENFFAAIRGEEKPNCDPRSAFATESLVWHLEAAAREHRIIDLSKDGFAV